jgi:O-glycosyl hydrolase
MNKTKYAFYITPFLALTLLCAFAACDLGYIGKVADAAEPVIVTQPRSMGVTKGASATLSVTAELPEGEGTLRYQWYQFTEFSDYQNQTGTPMANAAGSSFTPPSNVEGQFNYYVVVTGENNKVNGRRKNSVKSDSVTFSVNDPNNAWFPSITKHPAGGSVVWSTRMTPPALEVTAEVEEGHSDELRYQWYVAPSFTNTQGEAIEGATAARFVPPVALEGTDAGIGAITGPNTYYYFAIVTNFFFVSGRRESVAVSNPAAVSVIVNPNAETPVITAQPQNAIYFNTDSGKVKDLAIEVENPTDGGALSFSWFSNTRSSTTGGTAITAGTNVVDTETGKKATCGISSIIDLNKEGTTYFYVIVTNTNALVSNPRVSVTSRVAEITVTKPYGADDSNAVFTVQLGGTNQFQYVRGFGGMDVAWGNFPDYSVQDYENMFNPDILGYNMLRVMILPGNTDINKTMADLVSNQIYTTMDRSRFYENVRTVNRYGGYVLASPWSPPAAWKTNNSINGGGSLRVSNYQDYANYLRAFAQNMLNNGAPVYAISIQNEPNYPAGYDGCEWTSKEMSDFFAKVGRFTEGVAGFGGGQIIPSVKTMNGESANTTTINETAMNNPAARAAIDILGRHNYGSRDTSGKTWTYHVSDPREMWMTEHNLNSNSGTSYPNDHTWNYIWMLMNDIDMSIRINDEAAFIWWSLKRFYSSIGDGTYGSRDGEIPPRGWGLAHYAKFAKESYRTNVAFSGTLKNGQALAEGTNVNGTVFANFESTSAKVAAFVKLKNRDHYVAKWEQGVNWRNKVLDDIADIAEITLVMFTPTNANAAGDGGYDMGKVKIQLPDQFQISGATAMRSSRQIFSNNNRGTPVWESVPISSDRKAAYVDLPVSTILSVRFTQ